MDPYQAAADYVCTLPGIETWPELQRIIVRMASLEPRDWELPFRTCQAVGGRAEQAIPAAGAIACAQTGIIMIDDMLDHDPRGEYHQIGEAQTANFAAALLTAASESILQSSSSPSAKLASLQSLNVMTTTLALGQFLDVQNPSDEASYWRVVQMKSGCFFKSAFQLGALFGCSPVDVAEEVGKIGFLYGEMIQIHDDLGDSMTEPAGPDWTEGRLPLPILFAETVEHPDRSHFCELRKKMSDPGSLHEAQNILIRSGAVSYCIDQLMCRYQSADEILTGISLPQVNQLRTLLDSVITPVYRLLKECENV